MERGSWREKEWRVRDGEGDRKGGSPTSSGCGNDVMIVHSILYALITLATAALSEYDNKN